MARFRRNRQEAIEEPAVNLTPLIDVVFVILIMFILVAPMLELDRVELADAGDDRMASGVEVHETSPIALHVHKDNSIVLNGRKVRIDQLVSLLTQAHKKHPKVRPQIFHDKRAHFGTYQAVKNAAEEAGFQQIDIIFETLLML